MSTQSFDSGNLDAPTLLKVCGETDAHLRLIEKTLNITVRHRQGHFELLGPEAACAHAKAALKALLELSKIQKNVTLKDVQVLLARPPTFHTAITIQTPKRPIKPRSQTQAHYVECIEKNIIHFGIGPSGTGKTFLAVAKAVEALETKQVHRIVLARPAVEAGEKLGFLPGDLNQKVDPFLRPIFDAMHATMSSADIKHLMERNIIEIAPLAYLRGRTLSDAFIILDEAQNTTKEQLKMFITRLGMGSKMLINGDLSQIDLPKQQQSGLSHALHILANIEEIKVTHFKPSDVVRHPLLEKVLHAYEVK